ncbi:MAG: aldo/keto reductase [Capsulimonadaceae bacterium]|nr:aldo/keto reductase [Capsulimonadaceae bacterium]
MKFAKLGNTDITISKIIFGGWQSGKAMWVGIDDEQTIAAHRAAFEHGITTFDTAEGYGGGHSEQVLGAALADRRDEIVILTKVGPGNLSAEKLVAACERSLTNLKTDRIDLYQIHWPAGTFNTPVIPIEETIGALVKLKEQGKIRAIGVSNFSGAQIAEAQQFGRIDSVQPPYSLFWRQAEKDVIAAALRLSMSVLAYSPLAQGLLTGKFGPVHGLAKEDVRSNNRLFKEETYPKAIDAVNRLRPIAERNNISMAHLALAWLLALPGAHAIVGARNAEQASQNAAGADVTLSYKDLAEIELIGKSVSDDLLNVNPAMWA